ncbi:MAG: ASKHA domain-containing protein [Planctomycetota bacterium]|nr:ASKHA domain-containing protein [Planctomycetota bacterium]
MEQRPSLEIESPKGRQWVHVHTESQQRPLTDLLRRANFPLNMRCGGRGICDGCIIELVTGSLTHIPTGQTIIANDTPLPIRSCEHRLNGGAPASLRLPARSLVAYQPLVVTDFSINIPYAHSPLYRTPQINPAFRPIGAAIDIGTTTVVVLLLDLTDGRILAKSAAFNQQMHLGDDVVTRITLCSQNRDGLRQLQDAVANRTIAPLLADAMNQAGVSPDQIVCITIAGNTTMLHIAAGVDPSSMGVAPFTPTFLEHRILSPADLFSPATQPPDGPDSSFIVHRSSFPCSPSAAIHLLPSAAAYIGADLTAGIVASGLRYDPGPSLLVDAGTNGEIILKHADRLFGCATAAGPAFEGAGLSCGIRAGDGAISYITLTNDPLSVHAEVIGQEKNLRPEGLCGSAYIDFLAQARRLGLITPTGRFIRHAIPDSSGLLLPWGKNNTDLAFRIASADGKRPLVVSAVDIAHLLQAKAAIAAGILILLNQVGLDPSHIKRLYLAGGFGTHLNPQHAIDCGMLPGFRPDQILPVGNTALAGAYIAMLDSSIISELAHIGRHMHVVELNLDPNFEATYIDQLCLP